MDQKKKTTLEELISIAPEESEQERTDPETIDLEEPSRHVLRNIFFFLLFLGFVVGLAYAGYRVYQGKSSIGNDEKIKNTVEDTSGTQQTSESVPSKVYVDATDGLNLRSLADASSEIVMLLPDRAELVVLSEENGWYKVTYEGKEGYARAEFTTKILSPTQ